MRRRAVQRPSSARVAHLDRAPASGVGIHQESRASAAWAAFDARRAHGPQSPEYLTALGRLDEVRQAELEMDRIAREAGRLERRVRTLVEAS